MKKKLQIKKALMLFLLNLLCLLILYGCGSVKIGTQTVDVNATKVSITDATFDDYEVLKKLSRLSELDLSALSLSAGQYEQIAAQVADNVSILWNVPLGEEQYPNTSELLYLSEPQLPQAIEVLSYFSNLKSVTVEPCDLSEDLCRFIEEVHKQYPDAEVHCSSQIGGVVLDSETEKVVLNKVKLKDSDIIRLAIRAFPNIKVYEMCGCGLSNEVMGQLREDYPDITFIWTIKFDRFSVRTDAVAFSTYEYNIYRNVTEETFRPLFTYCTELRALDIGHHGVADLSGIANLKKLQVLILADNYITDISPLAELHELNYLEVDANRVTDVTPLTKLEHLENLSMNVNNCLKNILNLLDCKNLKSLYMVATNMKGKELDALIKGLPEECVFQYNYSSPYFHPISDEPKSRKIKKAFSDWQNVAEFDVNTPEIYVLKQ